VVDGYNNLQKNTFLDTITPMDINSTLPVIQIILAVLLTVSVLLQPSEAGAGGAFGGGDSVSTWRTRRGFEKFLFFFTIVVGILFVTSAIIALRIG
jgi:protein translocase SecG subunit